MYGMENPFSQSGSSVLVVSSPQLPVHPQIICWWGKIEAKKKRDPGAVQTLLSNVQNTGVLLTQSQSQTQHTGGYEES